MTSMYIWILFKTFINKYHLYWDSQLNIIYDFEKLDTLLAMNMSERRKAFLQLYILSPLFWHGYIQKSEKLIHRHHVLTVWCFFTTFFHNVSFSSRVFKQTYSEFFYFLVSCFNPPVVNSLSSLLIFIRTTRLCIVYTNFQILNLISYMIYALQITEK